VERLIRPWQGLAWELGRAWRAARGRLGLPGVALLGCAACAVLGLGLAHVQLARAKELAAQLAQRRAPAPAEVLPVAASSGMAGARARLQAFEALLLPAAEVPFVVQQLLDLGEEAGLTMAHGSYRPQADSAGAFLRYRMSMPVKGSGQAIEGYIRTALRKQPNLALDSLQFKRPSIGASDIEARIQWTLLVRLPDAGQEETR
jgi:hypothetical protein